MERLARFARYFRRKKAAPSPSDVVLGSGEDDDDERRRRDVLHVIESILLWENSVNSISVVVAFNILFW